MEQSCRGPGTARRPQQGLVPHLNAKCRTASSTHQSSIPAPPGPARGLCGYHRFFDRSFATIATHLRHSHMRALFNQPFLRVSVSLWFIVLTTGCTAMRETYTGQSADDVWNAMVAA